MRRMAVKKLKPAAYNPRKDLQPGDAEYEKIKRSIAEFGFVGGMVWNQRTGNLVSGHQRLKVLIAEFGVKELKVSVVDLPLQKEKALNVALNKIAGEWDAGGLAALLSELYEGGEFDATITGFDENEIDAAIAEVGFDGDAGAEIKPVTIKPYPKTSWTLIGIPFSRHGEVAKFIEKMSVVEGAIVECSYSD